MISQGMFEGALMGDAMAARRVAHQVAEQASADIDYLNAVVAEQEAQITELRERIVALATQVAVAKADFAGRDAQMKAFMSQHPDSPLLRDSGRRFRDGDTKTVSRLTFEAAFDAKAREMGIVDPEQHRAD
jgi:uncharacterized coiled-coil protein SlyX